MAIEAGWEMDFTPRANPEEAEKTRKILAELEAIVRWPDFWDYLYDAEKAFVRDMLASRRTMTKKQRAWAHRIIEKSENFDPTDMDGAPDPFD